MSLYRVAVLGLDDVAPFELGVLCEVFGTDRTLDGFPSYEFALCSPDGGPIRTRSGFGVVPHADLTPLASADLVAVPAHPLTSEVPAVAVDALKAAAERGAWILSVCSGAFLLGQAGLLDGRRCTTHWKHAALLAERYPTALVSPDELYVQDGRVITSAGTAAGIDACLHLVRQEQGAAVATKLARRMVVPPHRAGGQSQFIEAPMPEQVDCDTLQPLLEWLLTHLDEPLTVDDLASRTHMAPRTFARRFRAETGATPHDWLTHQRLLLARRLLEETELSVESVASRAGFGDSATLRHHFRRRIGTTPADYRHTFRAA
ncbi:GlxA family transcriptional regulator [Catellatospora methionotrophica]|uniref:GlxA family transcriptional regulator n=1 Tax=Catellatospora methionotrophica TaxID=121620 RepID=UPI003400D8D3